MSTNGTSSARGEARRAAALIARRPVLDALYASHHRLELAADPVQIVWRYEQPADREVIAFCAAALAFGRVASVLQSIDALAAVLGPTPAEFVRGFDHERADGLASLGHRWIRAADLVALLITLRHMLERAGTIERFFAEGDDPAAPDVTPGLESFSRRALEVDVRGAYAARRSRAHGARVEAGRGPGVAYFFPRPSCGSACKRLNLFLRWMVRRDEVDPGGWTAIDRARLVVPLDTHVVRLGQCLRLTRYRSPGWRMAADITASLRALDPADPVKYDFALCHLGMMGACGFRRPQRDAQCPLRGVCRPTGGRRRASRQPSAPR